MSNEQNNTSTGNTDGMDDAAASDGPNPFLSTISVGAMLTFSAGNENYYYAAPFPQVSFKAIAFGPPPSEASSIWVVSSYQYPYGGVNTAQISLQLQNSQEFWAMSPGLEGPALEDSGIHLVVLGSSPSTFQLLCDGSGQGSLRTDEGTSSTGLRLIDPFGGANFLAYGLPNRVTLLQVAIVG